MPHVSTFASVREPTTKNCKNPTQQILERSETMLVIGVGTYIEFKKQKE